MTSFQPGPGRGQAGRNPGRLPSAAVTADLTPDDARKIVEGDVKLLVDRARQAAQKLRDEASRTQLRRLYGEVKRIEMLWQGGKEDEAGRRLLLLKPRLYYQAARQSKLQALRQTIEPVIDAVGGDRRRFQRFVEFFEAIVAYAR